MVNKTNLKSEILKALQGYLAGEAQADAELDDLLIPNPETQETVALLHMIEQGQKEFEDGKTIPAEDVFEAIKDGLRQADQDNSASDEKVHKTFAKFGVDIDHD